MNYSASCTCGKVSLSIDLPSPIDTYQTRECDCDFCVARGLAYFSDPDGTLSFAPEEALNPLEQGSGQATFWECDHCHQVVAVTNEQDGEVRGAASRQLFAQQYRLQASITVSPKQLSPAEKVERWRTVWCKVV
ncbi:aldehyde-activating protein [Alteromonas ponticola]|uniref:Aldehyde-activating protein n=1 Tax=Alteromonas ponticola TaxID=2720613 RepID=A0ABX1R1J7_9ALTE|nr:aldehyde-activating protein [Alteromonas ponticola]NMH60334.1 aldehyde-activating protein [Alteromonas ponticola]